VFRFTITARAARDLSRIEMLSGEFDLRTPTPRQWMGRLRRELEAEAVAASTAIEGVAVTVEEVVRILAGDKPSAVSPVDAGLVLGYRDAMTYAVRRADDPDFTWHPELVKAIHDRAMGAQRSASPGRFRDRPVWLAGRHGTAIFEPPDADSVAGLVAETCGFAATASVPAPVLAALVHVSMAAIHPFVDGNGRTARVLASLAMFRGGYRLPEFTTLEEWWGSHQRDYYAAFRVLGDLWDPNVDVTRFVEVHVGAQRAQAEALKLRHATEREIWIALESIAAEELGMAPRAVEALYDAFFGRTVTNRYYRAIADVCVTTASADLGRLVASGLVLGVGKGRSQTYRGTFALLARVASATGSRVIAADATLEQQRAEVLRGVAERSWG
jgi:Fic family protein